MIRPCGWRLLFSVPASAISPKVTRAVGLASTVAATSVLSAVSKGSLGRRVRDRAHGDGLRLAMVIAFC